MENALIYLIDDDADYLDGLRELVSSLGYDIASYASAEDFLKDYDRSKPGCLVTDVRLENGMSGLDLQKRLVEAGDPLPVILTTAFADITKAVTAMRNGAVTFFEKPVLREQLAAAIAESLDSYERNKRWSEQRDTIRKKIAALTESEKAVLEKMVEGIPNKQIARRLDMGLRTAELRRSQIMKKLNANSLAEVVRYVMIAGFVGPSGVEYGMDAPETSRSENEEE